VNPDRRRLLAGVVMAAPMLAVGAAVLVALKQAGQFRVRRVTMSLPRLPERLKGLTITHLSDLHVGRFFRPDHLPAMVEAANRLASDLVVVTGDIIDHSTEFLEAACEAVGQLEHRYGRLVVAGNHDLIDSPRQFLEYVTLQEPQFLLDRHVRVNIGGELIQVAGLFWSRYPDGRGDDLGYTGRAERALAGWDPDRFTIGLVHHPHAFDVLAERGVDLTLAGHTHGGQVMLTAPGCRRPIGGGNLVFRYIWGPYHRGRSAMYVSAGVGNWFPVRLNAPAEIVQIQLV